MTELTEADLRELCRTPGKADKLASDAGFLLASSLASRTGADRFRAFARTTTFALLKPDSFAFGKAGPALEYFADHGLSVVALQSVWLTEASILALWRYQWNCATAERMAVSLAIGMMRPSLLLVLRAPRAATQLPLSVRLWGLKGSAAAQCRPADRLRSILHVNGRYFGYVHVPDEPADVVRELSILLGAHGLLALIERIEGEQRDELSTARLEVAALHRKWTLPWTPERAPEPACAPASAASITAAQLYVDIAARADTRIEPSAADWREDWSALAQVAAHITDNRPGIAPLVQSSGFEDPTQLWHHDRATASSYAAPQTTGERWRSCCSYK